MVRPICKDILLLRQPAQPATADDAAVVQRRDAVRHLGADGQLVESVIRDYPIIFRVDTYCPDHRVRVPIKTAVYKWSRRRIGIENLFADIYINC